MIDTSNGTVVDVLYETGERLEAARPEPANRGGLCCVAPALSLL
jgi:hypothetical protein